VPTSPLCSRLTSCSCCIRQRQPALAPAQRGGGRGESIAQLVTRGYGGAAKVTHPPPSLALLSAPLPAIPIAICDSTILLLFLQLSWADPSSPRKSTWPILLNPESPWASRIEDSSSRRRPRLLLGPRWSLPRLGGGCNGGERRGG
jgi:hypothetical protein